MANDESASEGRKLVGAFLPLRDAAEIRMVSAAIGTTVSEFVRASLMRSVKHFSPAQDGVGKPNQNQNQNHGN